MGDVIVAVVDDTIVEVGRVILVGDVSREVSQLTQVGLSVVVNFNKVASHFVHQHILVGSLLYCLEDTECIEH